MSHSFNKSIVREYDIRGIVSETLHIRDAYFLGRLFSKHIFTKYNNARIAVGYDGRLSSKILEKELVRGLKEGGAEVTKIGLCPSPMLYYASKTLDCDGAIMITGSHNPPSYNGFKILSREKNYYGKELKDLTKTKIKKQLCKKGKIRSFSIKHLYLKALTENLKKIEPKLKVVWDPGNGAAAEVIKSLIKIIPGKHFIINDEIDGTFPSHHPDPTVEENLIQIKQHIKKIDADLGIAFDGDGDRLGVVDAKLKFIPGDQLLLIFAHQVLRYHNEATIITDVKASDITLKQIKNIGGKPIMWKTGHSLIKSKMKRTGALLAGEMSGHVFFADRYYGFDDAIYAALRLLEIMSNKKPLESFLRPFSNVISTPELKIACRDEIKFSIINKCKDIIKKKYKNYTLVDGIRVRNNLGWWLIRASNTQPALIIRSEASSEIKLKKILKEIEDILQTAGINAKLKT